MLIAALAWAVNRANQNIVLPTAPLPTRPPNYSIQQDAQISGFTIVQAGHGRPVRLALPTVEQPGVRYPVVILLHGFNATALGGDWNGNWSSRVTENGFIAAFPTGLQKSWNAGECCRPASVLDTDDVAYLDAVISELRRRPDVDPDRVYLSGQSNGGMMVNRYLCEGHQRLTAAASVAGVDMVNCTPTEPLPFLTIIGRSDPVVPYEGGETALGFWVGQPSPPFRDEARSVAEAWKCGPADTSDEGSVERTTWSGCKGRGLVELVVVDGLDHSWPTEPLDAAVELMEFFDLSGP